MSTARILNLRCLRRFKINLGGGVELLINDKSVILVEKMVYCRCLQKAFCIALGLRPHAIQRASRRHLAVYSIHNMDNK